MTLALDATRRCTPASVRLAWSVGVVVGLLAAAFAAQVVHAQSRASTIALEHTVVPGDTLYELAERYETTVAELVDLNQLGSTTIRVGQQLRLPQAPQLGFRSHLTQGGETLAALADRYGLTEATLRSANGIGGDVGAFGPGIALLIPPVDGTTVRLRTGETLLSVAARYGLGPADLARINNYAGLGDALPGDPVLIPAGAETAPTPVATASVATPAPVAGHASLQDSLLGAAPRWLERYRPPQGFASPLTGRLTSRYGWRNISVAGNRFHAGVDFAAPTGTPVRAARDGIVRKAGWGGAYGYVVYLDHGDDSQTRYAHLSAIEVAPGATVRQGDAIGRVGSTGASTGPHLHFELRLAGTAVDPLPYLSGAIALP